MDTKQIVRANRYRIKSNLTILMGNYSKKQSQAMYYKLQKYEAIPQIQGSQKEQSLFQTVTINGVSFKKSLVKFQDEYTKNKKIGQGSHSVVYECQQKTTKKIYATKMLGNVEEEKIEFIKEKFQILSSFDDDHIIHAKALFYNQKEKTCNLVLEYCPYPTLREFIQQKKDTICEKIIQKIARQMLISTEILNNNNIFHRDLKPENILYDHTTGNLKIIDFQTAKRFTSDISLSTQTGSLFYRAPQSFLGFYGKKIDVWAIGVICYEILFLKLPFYAQNQKNTIKKIIQKPLQLTNKNCSETMKIFLSSLLKKSQAQRFSVEDALQFLNQHEKSQWKVISENETNHSEIQKNDLPKYINKLKRKSSQQIIPIRKASSSYNK